MVRIVASGTIQYALDNDFNGLGLESTRFKKRGPIGLTFETSHPDDSDDNMIVAVITPKYSFSTAFSDDTPTNPHLRNNLHSHDFYELLYVIEGEMYQNIEYERHLYPKGSLCLMNRNIRHAEEFSTDFRCVFVMLSPEFINGLFAHEEQYIFDEISRLHNSHLYKFFKEDIMDEESMYKEYMDFIPLSESGDIHTEMYQKFDELTSHFVPSGCGNTFALKDTLMQIFTMLSDPSKYGTAPVKFGSDKELELFSEIHEALSENYGRISRSELSKELNYSGSYLNSICKKYTGLSLFDYGMKLCMKRAAVLLSLKEIPVTDIAEELHFSNRSHFYSIFKKYYGVTPAEYRRNNIYQASQRLP